MINRLIDLSIQSLLKIIDPRDCKCKSVISIMLIIPKDILFKHAKTNNVQYGSDRKPFVIIKWEEIPVLIHLIGPLILIDYQSI